MDKQTAVEWLLATLEQNSIIDLDSVGSDTYYTIINEAKQMEKEQIIDAYNSGQQIPPFEYAERFYQENYGKTA